MDMQPKRTVLVSVVIINTIQSQGVSNIPQLMLTYLIFFFGILFSKKFKNFIS